MKPPPFAYARASSLDEALSLLAAAGEDAKLLAGGQSLMPLLTYRLARPTHLVDIGHLPGLNAITHADDALVIGALARHAQLELSASLTGPWQALREAASQIGHLPIRVRGTFGGSLAHADPAAELPVACIALQAQFVLRSCDGSRVVPADQFFAGPFMTILGPAEALTEARFPAPPPRLRSAFEEFTIRSGDFALASAAAALRLGADGTAHDARIAIGGVGPVPLRAAEAEAALEGTALTDEAIAAAARLASWACEPRGDAIADPIFRRELVEVLVARALRRLKEDR
jgi:CO/xanthine dehydrogenase FAD-binding subunit